MKTTDKKMFAIGTVIVTAILLAQCYSYYAPHEISISTENDGNDISYTINTVSNMCYSEIHLDNGFETPSVYYVLKDDGYASRIGSNKMESTFYLFFNEIERCPGLTVKTVNAGEMCALIENSLSSHTYGYGLIIISGAIPDIMYDGTPSSKLIQWVAGGGCLYWSGEPFGKYVATEDTTYEIPDYDTTVCSALFGHDHMFNNAPERAYAETKVNARFSDTVKMLCNETTYGADMSKCPSSTLFLGYSDGTYASSAFMKYGNGMLAILGGSGDTQYLYYLAHALSFRITYASELTDVHDGTTHGRSTSDSFADSPGLSHFVMLHDLRVVKIWTYDRTQEKFV